jgi:hypothetical protein
LLKRSPRRRLSSGVYLPSLLGIHLSPYKPERGCLTSSLMWSRIHAGYLLRSREEKRI